MRIREGIALAGKGGKVFPQGLPHPNGKKINRKYESFPELRLTIPGETGER